MLVDGVNVETEQAILEARNKVAEINERIHSQRSEQLTNENALIKEQGEKEKKKIEDTAKAEDKARKDKLKAEKQAAKDQIKIEETLAKIKEDLVSQGFALIGQLAGEESILGKAGAIAEIGIDTYKGATKSLASSPPPSPLGAIGAGIMIASGVASAVKASGIKLPKRKGASGGGGSAPSISAPSVASIPNFSENLTDDISTDETAAAINAQSRAPLKAYVTLSDLGEAQTISDNIEDNATL